MGVQLLLPRVCLLLRLYYMSTVANEVGQVKNRLANQKLPQQQEQRVSPGERSCHRKRTSLESTWVSWFCGSTVGQKCKQCLNSLRKWQRMLEQTMQVKTDLQHLTEMVNLLGKGVALTKTDFSCWLCCGAHLATRPVQ
jgi:hypothetical protein